MATAKPKRSTRRDSLSTFKPRAQSPQLDKTQGLQDSDYHLQSSTGAGSEESLLDVFDYRTLEEVSHLASGAFSDCYQAEYHGKKVVVKLLRDQYKDSHVTLKQMRFEQVLLSQLRHPNIVEFVGTGVYNGVPFTVLEKLHDTLNARISGDTKLAMVEVLTYSKMIGEALVYLHDQAIKGQVTLHRDLKPDNLAFDAAGQLKLIDFGLSRSVPRGTSIDEVYEMTGETGSLRYMAPEVAQGLLYNQKADVYSLSLITWQMAQGTKPFQGMSRKDFFHHVVHRHFRPALDPKWPAGLSQLIQRSWDPDYTRRPTAREYVQVCDGTAGVL
jgi:serine/threonine protein kinase